MEALNSDQTATVSRDEHAETHEVSSREISHGTSVDLGTLNEPESNNIDQGKNTKEETFAEVSGSTEGGFLVENNHPQIEDDNVSLSRTAEDYKVEDRIPMAENAIAPTTKPEPPGDVLSEGNCSGKDKNNLQLAEEKIEPGEGGDFQIEDEERDAIGPVHSHARKQSVSSIDTSKNLEDSTLPQKAKVLVVIENPLLPQQNEPNKSSDEAAAPSASLNSTDIRKRTRSLSSAVSSISGEDGLDHIVDYFDNDGKTPLKTNRSMKRSSSLGHGPMRKRHRGRALFSESGLPNGDTKAKTTQDAGLAKKTNENDANGDSLPSNEHATSDLQDFLSTKQSHDNEEIFDAFERTTRSRSNTIDSFHAAMDYQLHLPSESIILPEMKGDEGSDIVLPGNIVESVRERSDTLEFLTKSDPLPSPRSRSNTVDFLFAKHEEAGRARSTTLEVLTKSNPLELSDRERSDTIDFLTKSNPLDVSVRERSDTIDFLTKTNPLTTPRGRSDTVDFLSAAVGYDLDNNSGVEGDSDTQKAEATTTTSSKRDGHAGLKQKSERDNKYFEANSIHPDEVTFAPDAENHDEKKGVAFGKTPLKTNMSRKSSLQQEHSSLRGPLRKRYRTRSLSFANSVQTSSSKNSADPDDDRSEEDGSQEEGDEDEGDVATESESSAGRLRSNTLDSFHNIFGREQSDTMDFLTAAVAGDMGHDLDAAIAAAAGFGSSFAMHPISAPSGASMYAHRNPRRQRSDTLDSTASSINSTKLDFLVSVAAEEGILTSPVASRDQAESTVDDSTEHTIQRRPRSDTLEIFSNMSSNRPRSDTVDFLIGANEDPIGDIDDVVTLAEKGEANGNSTVLDHLKALCDEPKISVKKSTGILRRRRYSISDNVDVAPPPPMASPRATFDEESAALKRARANSEYTSKTNLSLDISTQKILAESMQPFDEEKRSRLESWGGMSDISYGVDPSSIAATHSALKSTGIIDDLMAAVADLGDDDDEFSEGLESESLEHIQRNRTNSGASSQGENGIVQTNRPRLDSLASLSLASLSDASISIAGTKDDVRESNLKSKGDSNDTKPQSSTMPPKEILTKQSQGTPSIVVDYDAIAAAVHAANAATEGLDLDTILNSPTTQSSAKISTPASRTSKPNTTMKPTAVSTYQKNDTVVNRKKPPQLLSTVTPPATATPIGKTAVPKQGILETPKSVPMAVTSAPILNSQTSRKPPLTPSSTIPPPRATPNNATPLQTSTGPKKTPKPKPPMPYAVTSMPFVPIPKSTKTEEEMAAIRERARAAAGYTPPTHGATPGKKSHGQNPIATPSNKFGPYPHPPSPYSNVPLKKRGLPHAPFTPTLPGHFYPNTPQYSKSPHYRPPRTPSSTNSKSSGVLQSQQKWDDMFQCLVKFIEETRVDSTKDMTEEEKVVWVWDGNVPTNYKTTCGKALGRWINNQRSAKAKGSLKDDREVRLVSTGLKWSVLTTNSWRDMLRELEIYVHEQTRNGRAWDGNVPTNYKIRSNLSADGSEIDEEKNLGRWINRQRSLFQAGKLKKERQLDLERIGLKWSVLLTTSWSTMFQSLRIYSEERRKESPDGTWDGNVPANHKTDTNPPLNLGRWVNRQRSAHAKGRLKQEFVQKLDAMGLKWVVHERKRSPEDDDDDFDDGDEGEEFITKESLQTMTVAAVGSNAGISLDENIMAPPLPPLSIPSNTTMPNPPPVPPANATSKIKRI